MRMLLTSEGLTNPTLVQALVGLCYQPPAESRVAFVPTSGNMKDIDKRWLLAHMVQIEQIGFEIFDIVDIAAIPEPTLRGRLEAADVIVFGGGDTKYLMEAIEQSGVNAYLRDLLKTRVYMGISAGAIVAGPDTTMGAHTAPWSTDGTGDAPGHPALGLTDQRVRPHVGRPDFPQITFGNVARVRALVDGPVWALDDASAVRIVDDEVTLVGNGRSRCYG